ncbi:hypothetical protein BGZ83_004976 [Gryganskiella cystojenkinii]|nr:hypothetical protein BGZ83_004976 [Gryganskiella cystojenkinii]
MNSVAARRRAMRSSRGVNDRFMSPENGPTFLSFFQAGQPGPFPDGINHEQDLDDGFRFHRHDSTTQMHLNGDNHETEAPQISNDIVLSSFSNSSPAISSPHPTLSEWLDSNGLDHQCWLTESELGVFAFDPERTVLKFMPYPFVNLTQLHNWANGASPTEHDRFFEFQSNRGFYRVYPEDGTVYFLCMRSDGRCQEGLYISGNLSMVQNRHFDNVILGHPEGQIWLTAHESFDDVNVHFWRRDSMFDIDRVKNTLEM